MRNRLERTTAEIPRASAGVGSRVEPEPAFTGAVGLGAEQRRGSRLADGIIVHREAASEPGLMRRASAERKSHIQRRARSDGVDELKAKFFRCPVKIVSPKNHNRIGYLGTDRGLDLFKPLRIVAAREAAGVVQRLAVRVGLARLGADTRIARFKIAGFRHNHETLGFTVFFGDRPVAAGHVRIALRIVRVLERLERAVDVRIKPPLFGAVDKIADIGFTGFGPVDIADIE